MSDTEMGNTVPLARAVPPPGYHPPPSAPPAGLHQSGDYDVTNNNKRQRLAGRRTRRKINKKRKTLKRGRKHNK